MSSSRFPPPIPPINVANLLKQYGLHADKRLGQNFLQDPYTLEKIINTAEIRPTDTVLEIGPGLGSLTRYLAPAAISPDSVPAAAASELACEESR